MTQQFKRRATTGQSFSKYEEKVLALLSENNALLKENNAILKKDHDSILRIEDYARGIKGNTSGMR